MRFGLLAAIMAGGALTGYAVKARGGFTEFRQPDGTILSLQLIGDENLHYYVDSAGNIYEAVGEAFRPMPDGRKPVAGLKRSYGRLPGTRFPNQGSPKALVILVEFANQNFITSEAHDYFTSMLSGEAFSENGASGSALRYFSDNSQGRFTPQFDVYGPVQLPNAVSYYGGNDEYGYDRRPHEMVIEACRYLDTDIDFRDYDVDNDGMIDNVFIFYAGRGEASGGGPNSIWPHSLSIRSLQLGERFMFDGVELNNYACTNEWVDNHTTGIGTFCHEFCHVLGLPDLYSITGFTDVFSPGDWSLMDHGSYNDDERTPAALSVFERYALDWIEPHVLEIGTDMTLKPVTDNEAAFLPAHDEGEFFLLENRQHQGWDKYLPGHGLLIWHIDYLERVWRNNTVNDQASHQYVDIEEADDIRDEFTRAGDAFPGTAGITRINDETSPSLRPWSGRKLKTEIREIVENPDGTVSFTVGRPGDSALADITAEGVGVTMCDGLLRIENPARIPVALASVSGIVLYNGNASQASLTIPQKGIYFLTVNGRCRKISM